LSINVLTSCIKEDISNLSNNILINQSFSIPFGPSDIAIPAPLITDTSSKPGRYGSFYYNNNIYPNNFTYFTTSYTINFSLHDKQSREDWIKRIVFHLLGTNGFPTAVYSQVYIYGQNVYQDGGSIVDSVFVNGPVLLEPASVNSQGDIEQSTSTIFDVPFEGTRLAMLKHAALLVYTGKVLSTGGKYSPIRLTDKNKININIAFQVDLQYNLQKASK
jgi:hypothetical protein